MSEKLLANIMHFQIGSSKDALSFSARLSRENAWHMAYAERCIEEYKKFIYLATISDKPITPSDQIDQVWHLHLTYTKSYWVDFCEKTLGQQLHHEPTKGGKVESNKFGFQYQWTLNKYHEVFGHYPPKDIWPSPTDRFKDTEQFIRLNKARYWILKKPSKWLLPIAAAPLLLAACVQTNTDSDIWFYAKVALGIYVAYKIFKWLNSGGGGKGGSGGGGFGCSGCSGCSGCGGCSD